MVVDQIYMIQHDHEIDDLENLRLYIHSLMIMYVHTLYIIIYVRMCINNWTLNAIASKA